MSLLNEDKKMILKFIEDHYDFISNNLRSGTLFCGGVQCFRCDLSSMCTKLKFENDEIKIFIEKQISEVLL